MTGDRGCNVVASGGGIDEPSSVGAGQETHLPKRRRLRFTGIKDKAVPHGYMHIDEALELLGTKRLPTEWGVGEVWREHPFQFEGKQPCIYDVERQADDSFKLVTFWLETTQPTDALQRADELYTEVRHELMTALEAGELQGFKFTDAEFPLLIPRGSSIWARHMRMIFYTGYAHDRVTKRKFRILLKRIDFDEWLQSPRGNSSQLSGHTKHVAAAIRRFAAEKGLMLTKPAVIHAVKAALGGKFSKAQIHRDIWEKLGDVKQVSRAPTLDMRARLKSAEAELVQTIAEAARPRTATSSLENNSTGDATTGS